MLPEAVRAPLIGSAIPRVAPPTPAVSMVDEFRDTATQLDIDLMPWQDTAARYLEAKGADGRNLYREVAIVVARQNGKTTLLVPLIVRRLRRGRRLMHTAQDRSLPREVFYLVADIMWAKYPDLFPLRNGRPTRPRYANGQEEIRLTNGGVYSIVAPTRGGARGPSRDDVIIDELREMDTWDFIAAAKPTMTTSPDPQMIYLSNAGEDDSVVLNAVRDRARLDPGLAYLEWSAAPERRSDDPVGWAEANPALGNERDGMGSVLETLQADHRTALLENTMAIFEVEHLCRWQGTTRQPLVSVDAWEDRVGDVGEPRRPVLAVSMDPSGKRASAALAWRMDDESIALRLLFDVPGDPLDANRLGRDIRTKAREFGATLVGFDPMTDAQLARHFARKEPIAGQKFANASAFFVTSIESGTLRWHDAAAVGTDLPWTARKEHDESGSFQAVRAEDDQPITAVLAAIRAVWLAANPKRPTTESKAPAAMGF